MKKLLMLCMMLVVTGCGAQDNPKSIEQLKAELAQKEASGGYEIDALKAVCVNDVLYYKFYVYGNYAYTVAINPDDKMPWRCKEAQRVR